jgi:UDP-glucose 4-epimerase
MHVFVTGGAGFIGSHLIDTLIERGHTVTVYDNLSSGNKQYIQHHLRNKRFTFYEQDLLDLPTLKQKMQHHDLIFHIAANPHVRLGETHTDLDLRYETIATYNVLEAMRTNNIKKIIFSSSSVVYGETSKIALPETYGPLLPISLYGAGKLGSEGLICAFCGTFDFQAWIFRFANVVGSRGTHGVIVDFIDKLKTNPQTLEILGDGKQQKPYLHVSDCVQGMLFGFEHGHDQINLFNLGCDSNTTVTEIAHAVIKAMNLSKVSLNYTGGKRGWPGDVPHFQLDFTKIKKLGWTPTYTSTEAIQKAIQEILHTYGEK